MRMMTRTALDMHSAERLAKLCGMLGSNHDGERAAAGLKADQLVRNLGLTWADVISGATTNWRMCASSQTDWHRMAAYCHRYRAALNPRDRAFVETMLTWRSQPTERQQDWLIDIYARLHRGACE
jgi:hypothetical protein